MKLLIFAVIILLSFSCKVNHYINTTDVADSKEKQIVFQRVNVIPMDREVVLQNQDVIVMNGKIQSIGNTNTVNYDNTALVVDGRGKYLIPGLAEMHAHVPPIAELEPMKEVALLFLYNGITTIRGMLGHPMHLQLRTMINNGEFVGPHFITSGPSFNGNSVKDAGSAESMVRSQKQAGYDFLKIHPGITLENFSVLARTANEVNIPFSGHVPFAVGIWRAIDFGYTTIDHLDGFVEGLIPDINTMTEQQTGLFGMNVSRKADSTQIPKLISSLKAKNIWVVPTQALAERWFDPAKSPESLNAAAEMKYMTPNMRNNWVQAKKNLLNNPNFNPSDVTHLIQLRRKLIYECNRNGVGLLLGCDAPQIFNVPGFSTHHELQYLVDAGLSPYDALKTGTVNVATFLNRQNDMGAIKVGYVSDLVLLNGNPLHDISQSRNIAGVMIGSRYMPKGYLDTELKKLEKN